MGLGFTEFGGLGGRDPSGESWGSVGCFYLLHISSLRVRPWGLGLRPGLRCCEHGGKSNGKKHGKGLLRSGLRFVI